MEPFVSSDGKLEIGYTVKDDDSYKPIYGTIEIGYTVKDNDSYKPPPCLWNTIAPCLQYTE